MEIISDTEEWEDGSDIDGISRDEELSSKKGTGAKKDKIKVKSRLDKTRKDKTKPKFKLKGKVKLENDPKLHKPAEEVIVKKEAELEQGKEKDGESLLDLLELEMRARAIRALIRKEEDIIPANPPSNITAQGSATNKNLSSDPSASVNAKIRAADRNLSFKVVQDKLQELGSSFRQSENKGIAVKTGQEISEEEDVVLVLQPTTTIELLSSESDGEGGQGKRRNQRLENERVPKNDEAIVQAPKVDGRSGGEENRKTIEDRSNEKSQVPITYVSPTVLAKEILTKTIESAVEPLSVSGSKTSVDSLKKVGNTELEMFRKLKRKTKDDTATVTTTATATADETPVSKVESSSSAEKTPTDEVSLPKNIGNSITDRQQESSKEIKKAGPDSEKNKDINPGLNASSEKALQIGSMKKEEKKSDSPQHREIDEDKSTDLEIVIDLDDYPDDMEELENSGTTNAGTGATKNTVEKRSEVSKEGAGKLVGESGNAAETWVTRYYQTDDVQSVIKESKIQSEIRKRLRERQRLARLNNSPGLNAAQPVQTATTSDKNGREKEKKSPTTGSVEEYMALKNVDSVPCTDSISLNNADGELGTTKILAEQSVVETSTDLPARDEKTNSKTEAIDDNIK